MTTIGGPSIAVTYQQIAGTNLEDRAQFATEGDKQLFLDAIKNAHEQQAAGVLNPTLSIPKPINAEALGLLDGKFSQVGEAFCDAVMDVMTVLHEMGVASKKAAKEAREVERDTQVGKLEQAADEIRTAAAFALAAGVVSGVATMAGGLMQLKGTFDAGKMTAQSKAIIDAPEGQLMGPNGQPVLGKGGKPVPDLSQSQSTQIGYLNSRADILRTQWQAGGMVVQGAGDVAKAGLEYQSKMHEAQRAELEAEATSHQYEAQNKNEIVENMRDLVNDVRAKLGEILQAQSQVESKIWS